VLDHLTAAASAALSMLCGIAKLNELGPESTFAAVAGRLLPSPVRKECFAQAAYYAPARWQLLKKIYGPVTAR